MSLVECSNCNYYNKPGSQFCESCGSALKVSTTMPNQSVASGQRHILVANPDTNSMEKITPNSYIQVIAALEIVFGFCFLFLALIIGLVSQLLIEILRSEGEQLPAGLENFAQMILFILALFLFAYAIASIYFGIRLLQEKSSGRIGTMIIASINLAWIPFGTLYGLVALYLLTRPDVEQRYR